MQQTKKIVSFVVEIYELETYWSKVVYRESFSFFSKPRMISEERCLLIPSCYKRTYYRKFNSIRKLNESLGLKKGNRYYFHTSLEDAIKGIYGYGYQIIRDSPQRIFIVRQLHDLDNRYVFKS